MWGELERFIRVHASTSPQHKSVLECLTDCKGSSLDDATDSKKDEKSDLSVADKALQDFDK